MQVYIMQFLINLWVWNFEVKSAKTKEIFALFYLNFFHVLKKQTQKNCKFTKNQKVSKLWILGGLIHISTMLSTKKVNKKKKNISKIYKKS